MAVGPPQDPREGPQVHPAGVQHQRGGAPGGGHREAHRKPLRDRGRRGGEGREGGVRDCRIHCRLAPSPSSHNFLSLTLKPDTVRLIVLLSSACVALFVSSSFSRARAFLESLALWANVEGAFRASACLRSDLISSSSTARLVFPGGMTEREWIKLCRPLQARRVRGTESSERMASHDGCRSVRRVRGFRRGSSPARRPGSSVSQPRAPAGLWKCWSKKKKISLGFRLDGDDEVFLAVGKRGSERGETI